MKIIPFPRRGAPEIVENVSPAMAAAFRAIEQKGLNTQTARALADVHAKTPRELCAVVSVLVAAMDEPPGGFADAIAETLWRRSFEHTPLPESFGFDLGMLITVAETRAQVSPARFRHILPLVASIDRDFEKMGAELFGVVGHA
jgi:hypothetical protein